jgi:hypothetical protein
MNDVALNPGRVFHARYTLQQRLGTGGQGEVWRARDVQRESDVALKILHPPASERAAARAALEREYAINSRLDHPNILKLFAPEDTRQGLLLPMELASGGDLRQLRGAGYLAVLPLLLEVADALAHAHERGVIHRDLKPGNVLLDASGSAKLADFGVAGTVGVRDAGKALSPFTASPQQLRGEPPAAADDIYGLGALAYELLSGRPPHYPNFDPARVQNEPVPDLAPAQQMPPQLTALVRRMLSKDPTARPDIREVIEGFDAALNDTLTFEFETAEPPREGSPAERTGKHPALTEVRATPPPPAALPEVVVSPPVAPRPPPVDVLTPDTLDGPGLWEELRLAPTAATPSRLEPMRGGSSRLTWLIAAVAAAFAIFFILPHPNWLPRMGSATAPAAAAEASALRTERAAYDRRLAALEARGAAKWDATDLGAARDRAAESTGAFDAGSVALARARLDAAMQLLDAVERTAPRPTSTATVAPAAAAAAAARSRDDDYARAAGEGYAALGAGRLAEARAAFERARAIRPTGPEAIDGLRRVAAASATTAATTTAASTTAPPATRAPASPGAAVQPVAAEGSAGADRSAQQLEAQERWDEAAAAYAAQLRAHPNDAAAESGRNRASARARLDHSLQALLDQPDQLADPDVQARAAALLANAQATTPSGAVLRSQIARLQILLPEYGKPVALSLVSDGVTQVAILSVGSFGSFDRRDIELRPGTYTVIGSRLGYRDVRREITVTPGEHQTVSVSCYERT